MTSPPLHLLPIHVVVSDGPQRCLIPETASRLDAFSAYPDRTWIPGGAAGATTGKPVVRPTRSSRTKVRPPRNILRPQQIETELSVTSRHRGAKPLRRFELLGAISLLSPEYLLSFERRPFHSVPPDHFALLSHLIDLSVSQSSTLVPMHSAHGCHSC